MAAVEQNLVNSDDQFKNCDSPTQNSEIDSKSSDSKSEFQKNINELADILSKLNPWAKEFIPSSYRLKNDQSVQTDFSAPTKNVGNDKFPNNRRRKINFNQGKRRMNGRAFSAQREESVRRTVYVSDIDQHVTEERLAALFSGCGQVVDCRICGDPHSVLRFAFVEFADEYGARAALNLGGTMLGYYPVRVLPSKTAIVPVNPTFLPRSEDEREMCARTVYCTNIDKKVSQVEVKNFFESACGEVSRLRLLGDNVHSTRIAFVEFEWLLGVRWLAYLLTSSDNALKELLLGGGNGSDVFRANFAALASEGTGKKILCYPAVNQLVFLEQAESAILALNCSGMILGTQPIRVSPSKTPVRPRLPRPAAPN